VARRRYDQYRPAISVGAALADGTRLLFNFSSEGVALLREWADGAANAGMVGIIQPGSVSVYSSEAADLARRPRLVVTLQRNVAHGWMLYE